MTKADTLLDNHNPYDGIGGLFLREDVLKFAQELCSLAFEAGYNLDIHDCGGGVVPKPKTKQEFLDSIFKDNND